MHLQIFMFFTASICFPCLPQSLRLYPRSAGQLHFLQYTSEDLVHLNSNLQLLTSTLITVLASKMCYSIFLVCTYTQRPQTVFKFLSPYVGRCWMTSAQQFFCCYKFWSYIHGLDCERSNRNSTTCQKLQNGGWLHIKSYIAAGNQFTKMLSTTRNRQPSPSAMTFWLIPLIRGITFHPVPGQTEICTAHSRTPGHQFWFY